jgi:hypothetical protein
MLEGRVPDAGSEDANIRQKKDVNELSLFKIESFTVLEGGNTDCCRMVNFRACERAFVHVGTEQQLKWKLGEGGNIEKHLTGWERVSGFPMPPCGGRDTQLAGRGCGLQTLGRPPPLEPGPEDGPVGKKMRFVMMWHWRTFPTKDRNTSGHSTAKVKTRSPDAGYGLSATLSRMMPPPTSFEVERNSMVMAPLAEAAICRDRVAQLGTFWDEFRSRLATSWPLA